MKLNWYTNNILIPTGNSNARFGEREDGKFYIEGYTFYSLESLREDPKLIQEIELHLVMLKDNWATIPYSVRFEI